MYTSGKGISGSALPYKRTPPSWLKVTSEQVEEHVCKLAKKGLTPSQVIFCASACIELHVLPLSLSTAVCKCYLYNLCLLLLLLHTAATCLPTVIIQIGVILRDSNGIAQVKSITGNKIVRLLKKNGNNCIPLYMLIN